MDVFADILEKLKKAGAVVIPPAKEEMINPFRMTLARNKIPMPAPDYFKFLSLCDGLTYNGLKLYGIETHRREEKNYTFPSLLEVNVDFMGRNRTKDFIILGEQDEDLFVYHSKEKNYQIVDRMDLITELNLPRFFDLVYLLSEDILNEKK